MKSFIIPLLLLTIFFCGNIAFASPTLSVNSKGAEVAILQEKLLSIGYDISIIDGEFGNETKAAVEQFQLDHDLTVTGVVNNATWRALKSVKSVKLKRKSSGGESDFKPLISDSKLVPFGKLLINRNQARAVLATGKKLIGVPYVFGGTTPNGFDCSGFLQYIFKQNGIAIPRLADEQFKLGKKATTDELVEGDLVFFTTYESGASHCGIYVGNGEFLHTSSSRGVRIDSLNNVYWAPRFYGAKRIVEI